MNQSSVRSATAGAGKTVLALFATLSLLLSAFAVAQPVIANHDVAGPAVTPTVQPGNPTCPAGTTEIKFEGGNLASGKTLSTTIDGQEVSVTLTNVDVDGGSFDFEVDGGLAYVVIAKGGPNANVYDYRTLDPPGTAHDDGLTTPINPNTGSPYGLSHISFCVVPIVASIDVTKTGPDQTKIGDETPYTITIENTGDVDLFIESVTDSLAGDLTADVAAECDPLLVGTTCTFEYTYTPDGSEGDPLQNTVTVVANTAADFSGDQASDTANATVELFEPSIDVTKEANVTEAVVGDTITYTVTILNTSSADSPALDITLIDDSLVGDLTAECPDTLAPGADCTFDYTYVVQEGDDDPLQNTVVVESNPVGFTNDIDDSDDAEVDLLLPSIDVEKDGPPLSKVTDPTAYTVTITNDGETVLHIVSIDDTLQGDLTDGTNVDSSDCGASLAIGASCTITYTYVVQEGDDDPLPNTVTAVANTADDFTGVEVDDSDSVNVELFQPDIEVTKVGDVTEAMVGDDVTYTVTIENTSSADSPDLVFDAIDDSLQGDLTNAGNVDSSDCGATLAAGDDCTIVYTRTVLETDPDPLENTVSVESHPDGFTNDIDDSDSFEVDIVEAPAGSVTIVKDVGDCEICETATPGRWFNMSPGTDTTPGTEFANESLGTDPITLAGEEFASVDDVHEHAKPGSLLWHTLGLEMNVRWGLSAECDLSSLVYAGADSDFHDMTVGEILQEAKNFLDGLGSSFTEQQLHDVVAEINESETGDGTLVCPAESDGAAGANFEFELWVASDYPNDPPGPEQTGTTSGSGELTFSGLEIGVEYLLVEVGGPDPDLTCAIVSADGVELDVAFDAELGTITFTLTENVLNLTIEVTNECEEEEEEEFAVDLIKVDQDDNTLEGVEFSLTGEGYAASDTSDDDGEIRFEGLLAGEVYVLTETEGFEDCVTSGPWTVTVAMDGSISIVDADDNVLATEGGAFVIVNLCEEEDELGELEIIKFFCPSVGDDRIFVIGPLSEEPVEFSIQSEEAQLPSDEDCTLGAPSDDALGVWFEITGGDLEEPMLVQTSWDLILTLDLPAGQYTITEVATGLSADFEISLTDDTAVVVFNFLGEEEEDQGLLKILKFNCVGEGDPVFTIVDGDADLEDVLELPADCEDPEIGDATFTLTFGELTSAEFTLGADGGRLIPLDVGTYVLNEVDPGVGSSDDIEIAADETTTAIVFNFEGEDLAPEEETPTTRGGELPSQGGPGQGTLPNTATAPAPTSSIPAALLALVMLTGLGAAGYAMQAEARRRR